MSAIQSILAVTSGGIDFLVNLFVNNGTAIAVIAYFMWRDFKFMDTLNSALQKLIETTETLKTLIKVSKNSLFASNFSARSLYYI